MVIVGKPLFLLLNWSSCCITSVRQVATHQAFWSEMNRLISTLEIEYHLHDVRQLSFGFWLQRQQYQKHLLWWHKPGFFPLHFMWVWVALRCTQTSVKSSILKDRHRAVAKSQPWKLLENSECSVSQEMPLFSSQLPLNWHPALSPHKHSGVWDPLSWEKGGCYGKLKAHVAQAC